MRKGENRLKVHSFFIVLIIGLLIFVVGCSKEEATETQPSLPKYTFKKGEFPPSPTGFVKVNGIDYEMMKGGFRWEKGNMVTQTDAAGPTQIAAHFEAIKGGANSKVSIEVEQSPKLNVLLWEEEKTTTIHLNENKLTVPENKGRYIYEVQAAWENGEVSYTFVVEVQ